MHHRDISIVLRHTCEHNRSVEIFSRTLQRLEDETLPNSKFVKQLTDPTSWTSERRQHFFGSQGSGNGPLPVWVNSCIPDFEAFLQKIAPDTDRFIPFSSGQLIHDLIGHLLLKQPTTPRGEIVACAGAAGFSWDAGADFFVNALLMFSLGLPIFEGVTIGHCPVDQALVQDCNWAWNRSKTLRNLLNTEDVDVTALAFQIVEQWPILTGYSSVGAQV